MFVFGVAVTAAVTAAVDIVVDVVIVVVVATESRIGDVAPFVFVSDTNCSIVFFFDELRSSVAFFRWSLCRFFCL